MEPDVLEVNSCEVCGNTNLSAVLNLGKHPMCDDLIPVGNDRVCNEYPIEIIFCKTCQTAHQRYQVPKVDLFPSNYHYRSRFTADVLNGMKKLVENTEQKCGSLAGKKVLDIGCNDGSLLDFFKEKGAQTFGIEPTGAFSDAAEKGHPTYNDFLTPEVADKFVSQYGKPDIITFTNVFAHIEDLPSVIKSLQIMMKPHTNIVIENHYLGSVLKGSQFDTFYHEHPRTYSATSFVYIAKSLGLKLSDVEFPSRYGGNIRVYMGEISQETPSTDLDNLLREEEGFYDQFVSMNQNIQKWCKNKKVFLEEKVKEYGKLRAKAFPGRAAILIKLLDLNENQIEAVFEKPGSLKVGHYLPGTRIPIKSDDELLNMQDKSLPILNLAWHISDEIHSYLKSNGYQGEIYDIIDKNDF